MIRFGPPLWRKFEEWHETNIHVWPLFVRFTFDAIRAGRVRFSSDAVIQRIRWFTNVETTGSEFKVNDHFSAYYARVFMAYFPQHAQFFETRAIEEDEETLERIVARLRARDTA